MELRVENEVKRYCFASTYTQQLSSNCNTTNAKRFHFLQFSHRRGKGVNYFSSRVNDMET